MTIVILIIVGICMLYIFLICPRLTKQKEVNEFKGRYYAHRGLHNNQSMEPENSLPAFEKAVANHYGIELDVQLTKDEVMVVFHDETLERMCGDHGRIEDYTYIELQRFYLLRTTERIPTLTQVIELVDGQVPLIIEIKMHARKTRICEVLNRNLIEYHGLYCVESFNPLAIYWYKKHQSHIIRGQLSTALNKESNQKNFVFFLVEHLLTNILTRPDFIAYNHKYKNRIGRKICRNVFGCLSVTWTIKSKHELEEAKNSFDIFIFEGFQPSNIS